MVNVCGLGGDIEPSVYEPLPEEFEPWPRSRPGQADLDHPQDSQAFEGARFRCCGAGTPRPAIRDQSLIGSSIGTGRT